MEENNTQWKMKTSLFDNDLALDARDKVIADLRARIEAGINTPGLERAELCWVMAYAEILRIVATSCGQNEFDAADAKRWKERIIEVFDAATTQRMSWRRDIVKCLDGLQQLARTAKLNA